MSASQPPFIECAPRDVAGWARLFDHVRLPVLASTAAVLEDMRHMEDAVDAHMLAEFIVLDPLMTLKVLAHVANMRRGREGGEIETVTEALVMLGIPPFFRAFGPQEAVEDRLAQRPEAQAGFDNVLLRSRRAASFALGFAVHRMDQDASVIHEAALLHDFAEMLLWLEAPGLALAVQGRLASDPNLRSKVAQRAVLHIELADLQHALLEAWRLPSLLVGITDGHARHANAQVRNVLLSIRLARHSTKGWDNPALPDDLREAGELLQLSTEAVQRLLLEIDAD